MAARDAQGRRVLEPGVNHPISIEPTDAQVTVSVAGQRVALSRDALIMRESGYPPVYYLPMGDVTAPLIPSDQSTYCPYKGEASYFSREVGDQVVADLVWSYPDALPAMAAIEGRAAFATGPATVTVEP